MRIVSFTHPQGSSWGVVSGRGVIDLGVRPHEAGETLAQALATGGLIDIAAACADATVDWSLDEIQLLPPVPSPGKVLCVGLNYATHIKEMGRPLEDYPTVFTRFSDTFVGHDQPLVRPHNSVAFDYEGELAIVIGSGGRHIPVERALEHVAGYTCLNDGSIRDFQRHTHQFTPGKNFPGSGAVGPWLVTRDEVPDITAETITTRLNGVVVQQSGLDDLVFDVAAIVAYCSSWTRLSAGDVIATGTPGGVGAARDPQLWMKPGDVVEVEISGVGLLRNTVIDESVPTGPRA